ARDVIRVGNAGDGQVVKLGNNLMAAVNIATVFEAVRFVKSFGFDEQKFLAVVKVSTRRCGASDNYDHFINICKTHTMADEPVELMHRFGAKDLRYIVS